MKKDKNSVPKLEITGGFPNYDTANTVIVINAEIHLELLKKQYITIDELHILAADYIRKGKIERCGISTLGTPPHVIIKLEVD